jgi:uncharacterized membrane protein
MVVVNPWDIPQQKSVGAAIALTLFFGPFGMFYVSGKAGLWSLVGTVVGGICTLGISIVIMWVGFPLVAMSMVQKSNARRAQMLAAVSQ